MSLLHLNEQQYWLRRAYQLALRSPDPSTQNGAVILDCGEWLTDGVNAPPLSITMTPERWERPAKYAYVEHAERSAIYRLIDTADLGTYTDVVMVCPWAACADCCRAIIAAGISELVTHKQAYDRSPDRWLESIAPGYEMLREAGVTITMYDGEIGGIEGVLHSGERWNP